MSRELLRRVMDNTLSSWDLSKPDIVELKNEIESELAKPEIDPVAWMWQSDNYDTTFSQRVFQYKLEAEQMKIRHAGKLYPLYASPPDTERRLSEALTAANRFRAERDELRARIDSGIRCHTNIAEALTKGVTNATLIFDEGVTLL